MNRLVSGRDIYSVSHLNQKVRDLLEGSFPLIWVEGEISNLSRPVSGHLYFSLKDAKAQVRCALFRNRLLHLHRPPENGQKVLVQAQISLYEPRGDYQLIIEYLEDAGEGALRRAYEERRLRLEKEGLFDLKSKRPLPRLPRCIGVLTSPTGAAIRDVLSILQRRFPALPVLVYPVPVQGEGAAEQIAKTIQLASDHRHCDVLLVVRGGGSLEDLWAFNEESVARAIRACTIPVISGIGHETDVTIADFAADLRAPTPSAAAELVSPDRFEWLQKFSLSAARLEELLRRRLATSHQTLAWWQRRLLALHPGRRLQDRTQRLDELAQRLQNATVIRLERLEANLKGLGWRLTSQVPLPRIERLQERQQTLYGRLTVAMQQHLGDHHQHLAAVSRTLHTLSPLQTLGRGYAILRRYPQGELLRHTEQVHPGDRLEALLAEGQLICEVIDIPIS